MDNQFNSMEPAKSFENKSCNACGLGVACLSNGVIPDFEIGAVAGLFTIWGTTPFSRCRAIPILHKV